MLPDPVPLATDGDGAVKCGEFEVRRVINVKCTSDFEDLLHKKGTIFHQ